MKICIVGAGAIGGWIGTRLALTEGTEVSALARGATLAALRQHGWRMQQGEASFNAPVHASDRADELGPQDLVVVALKGHALPAVAPTLAPLLGPNTVVLPAMNGVPWWFCQNQPGWDNAPLSCVDAGGVITRAIDLKHVVGCVVHASISAPEPGLVKHHMGQGLIIGEPAGGLSERVRGLAECLTRAGFEVTASSNVRHDIWYKLWGNLTTNPITAITGATVDRVLANPLTRAWCTALMIEAAQIGERIGCPIAQTPEDRHAITAKLGAFKTSMLQDTLAGRQIELDAIVGVVQEIGRRVGMATPNIDTLLGLTQLFAQTHGLLGPARG